VRELRLVSSWQEAVEDGRNLTFEDQLAVDESHFLLRHLRLSSATSFLTSRRGWPVLVVVLFLVEVFGEGGLGLEGILRA
jgi:hypothetical protein